MINNRQAGRRRGRNNPRQNGGGNRGNGDSGNRIDSRARGNAAQLLEKYRNLARDAQLAGDRVNAEYYFQFADHYFRVLADNRARQEEQQARFRRPDDNDQDMGDEGDDSYDVGADDGDDFMPQPQQQEMRPRRDRDGDRDRGRDRGDRNDRGERGERNDRGERSERPERPERGERPERAELPDRGERNQRNRDGGNEGSSRRDGGQRRRQPVANDDAGEDQGDIGLPGLPPSIARIDAEPMDDVGGNDVDAVEPAPKPRRGRRPRQSEAAE